MTVAPDTKDRTWVVERACPECGEDPASYEATSTGARLRAAASAWSSVLAAAPARLRARPDDSTWSPLEYACHVLDVLRVHDERLRLMLETEAPRQDDGDQDAAADYLREDCASVAADLQVEAARPADRFDGVQDWTRTGHRSDGASFTVDTFSRPSCTTSCTTRGTSARADPADRPAHGPRHDGLGGRGDHRVEPAAVALAGGATRTR